MKLIYFSRDYTPHDHRFLSALSASGYQVYYLRLERRGHNLEDRPVPPSVQIISWAGGQRPARLQDGLPLLADLRRIIRTIKPDLILAGPLQTAAFLVALSRFQPLVSMSWGYDLLVDAQRNNLWRWATRYTLKHSAAMVGDCQTIYNLAVSHGMAGDRIVIFPWGVDLERFSPLVTRDKFSEQRSETGHMQPIQDDALDAQGQPSPFTLLSTRGWEAIYGVDLIAKAFSQVARRCPGFRLVMLGGGTQAAKLRDVFFRYGVTEQVSFPGQISQADLPRYYHMADLYISASHSDGTSISLLEAMACGLPVVVSDIPGNREWVTHGENGWLFPDGDVQALEQLLEQAYQKRIDLKDMGAAARRLAEAKANWDENYPGIFRAFELALDH